MFIFSQLNSGPCKTYLIANQGLAMLVDPVLEEVDACVHEIERDKLSLQMIVDTHVHADHISGGAALRDRTGADYVMHERTASHCVSRRVAHGDVLSLGDLSARVIHTPGHTPDSISLVFPDRILTGDFLFIGKGGAGRTDLPGGDAGAHWDSLVELQALPDEMMVFPAHDYHDRVCSTLGEERKNNPRLQPRSREDYVAWLDDLRLGAADWMEEVVKANYACARDPRAVWIPVDQPTCEVSGTSTNVNTEAVRTITADELAMAMTWRDPPTVIDVREFSEFIGALGHLDGAKLIPVGELPHRLGELKGSESRSIVTVCRSGGRSITAAAILTVAGFTNVRSLEGGMLRWNERLAKQASSPLWVG